MKTTPFYLPLFILTAGAAAAAPGAAGLAVAVQMPAAPSSPSAAARTGNEETQQSAESPGTEANTRAGAPLPSVQELASAGPAGSLDSGEVLKKIRTITIETRNRMLDEIKIRLDASERALDALQQQLRKQGGEGKLEFSNALNDAKTKERELRLTVGQAGGADALGFPAARSILAGDYGAYATAAAKAEAAAKSAQKK